MLTIPILPMSQKFARTLHDQDQVEHFLKNVLDLDYSQLGNDIAYRIIQGEHGVARFNANSQTIDDTRFRDREYKEDSKRWHLRKQIIEELMTLSRPDNDDDICLGHGGALPQNEIRKDCQAYILIGLPASGKSSVAAFISKQNGAIILDSDFAKRKLPEFSKYTWGATAVHEESNQIINGFTNNPNEVLSVYELATQLKYNLVVPKIGQNINSIINICRRLKGAGYTVHLTLVSLFRKEATIRALHRFNDTGRYVPLGLIFDGYSNDPCLSYYILRNQEQDIISTFGAISTNVAKGEPFKTIDLKGNNPAELFREKKDNKIIAYEVS